MPKTTICTGTPCRGDSLEEYCFEAEVCPTCHGEGDVWMWGPGEVITDEQRVQLESSPEALSEGWTADRVTCPHPGCNGKGYLTEAK